MFHQNIPPAPQSATAGRVDLQELALLIFAVKGSVTPEHRAKGVSNDPAAALGTCPEPCSIATLFT